MGPHGFWELSFPGTFSSFNRAGVKTQSLLHAPGPHQSQIQGQNDSLIPGRKDVLAAFAEAWKRHSRHATGRAEPTSMETALTCVLLSSVP